MICNTVAAQAGSNGDALRIILVVEDDERILTLAAEFLRDSGFIVIEACNVVEAKDMLLNWHVDLVFSDINLSNQETASRWKIGSAITTPV